ncbi:MAG: DUF2007 domain-containing protein [Planctomycetota bacterium]|nr:DUF2007 domain-containing protein [Planctomycetota bacterium]
MSELVEVYEAHDVPQAHIIKGVLDEAGIPAVIENEELSNVLGALQMGRSAPRVMVPAELAERAREILRDFEAKPD